MQIEFLSWRDAGWQAAATLIEDHFARVHGATIRVPAIRLAAARSQTGALLGAAGIRDHRSGFFSQVYLTQPLAQDIGARAGTDLQDRDVIEVVSMACPAPMATLPLIDAIIAQGRREGRSWGVFTATGPLMRLLRRTGAALLPLAPARPERLADAGQWGRYYQTDPWVCALHDPARALRRAPGSALTTPPAPPPATTGASA